jgi:hypothetical protein
VPAAIPEALAEIVAVADPPTPADAFMLAVSQLPPDVVVAAALAVRLPVPLLLIVKVVDAFAFAAALNETEPGLTDSSGPVADPDTLSVTFALADAAPGLVAVITAPYVPALRDAFWKVALTFHDDVPDTATGWLKVIHCPPPVVLTVTLGVAVAPPWAVTVITWPAALAPTDAFA